MASFQSTSRYATWTSRRTCRLRSPWTKPHPSPGGSSSWPRWRASSSSLSLSSSCGSWDSSSGDGLNVPLPKPFFNFILSTYSSAIHFTCGYFKRHRPEHRAHIADDAQPLNPPNGHNGHPYNPYSRPFYPGDEAL